MNAKHSFHIPVMGVAFTADTPLKVAKYGIDSVIALADDFLLERLRKMYSSEYNLEYTEIKKDTKDYRANRITSYLNLINKLSKKKLDELTSATEDKIDELKNYFSMLPDGEQLKKEFLKKVNKTFNIEEISSWLKENLSLGSIDVNIMTKVDKENYYKNEKLPSQYNDAHAALRGYANSDLASSVVFSAGMNPRLYSYISQFNDFFPSTNGYIKKKIVLKVSDYRSAIIQGKFLAKKGLWVSEYRIESGLNCGGHAFATEGMLLGPILDEFKNKKAALIDETFSLLINGLKANSKIIPSKKLPIKITVQGGVGNNEEHKLLLDHYNVDSVGWGTPFLLVPEATTVDEATLKQLIEAKEKDLYLSNISPLGVPFNNLRNSSKDVEKMQKVNLGKPGSSCPKRFLAFSNEYSDRGVCTASRLYQKNKLKEIPENDIDAVNNIIDKACICVGLTASANVKYNLGTKDGSAISICPGPNMAYFSKVEKFADMISHVYGKIPNISRIDRPHFFIKELKLYIDYLSNKIDEAKNDWNKKNEKYFSKFISNLNDGIVYYEELFSELNNNSKDKMASIFQLLKKERNKLRQIEILNDKNILSVV